MLEDWQHSSVGAGKIRMDGQFSGTVTTSTHCMEICLPLQYDLSLRLAEMLLTEFHEQDLSHMEEDKASKEGAGRRASDASTAEEEEGPEERQLREKPVLAETWNELRRIFQLQSHQVDKTDPNAVLGGRERELMRNHGYAERGHADAHLGLPQAGDLKHAATFTMVDSEMRKGRATSDAERLNMVQHADELLKVDLRAKENLIKEMQEELERLREENVQLEEGQHQSGFAKFLDVVRHIGNEECTSSDGDSDEDGEEEIVDERPPKLAAGEMWLNGEFIGQAMTKKHMLDIHLPVKGTFAGNRASEVLHSVVETFAKVKGAKAVMKEDLTGLTQLAKLFEAEYGTAPPERGSEALASGVGRASDASRELLPNPQAQNGFATLGALSAPGPQSSDELVELKYALEDIHQALQRKEVELQCTAQELQGARSETLKFQVEAEKLRAKGLVQAQHLDAVEASAEQLKEQLRNMQLRMVAGGQGVESSSAAPRCLTTPTGAGGFSGLSGRSPSLLDAQEASPFLPAAACRAPQEEARPPNPPLSTFQVLGAGADAATLRMAAAEGHMVLPDVLSNPAAAFQRVTQEAAKEHKALVQDLKELERWAKELRTLSG